jgi:hypothetical protein
MGKGNVDSYGYFLSLFCFLAGYGEHLVYFLTMLDVLGGFQFRCHCCFCIVFLVGVH